MAGVVWDTADPRAVETGAGGTSGSNGSGGSAVPADHAAAGDAAAGDAASGHPAGHIGHPHTGDQTRVRILQVALELIADRGYAATSTREIAERLGFTKAALYYHFRTKDDLLAAIVGPVMAELEALIEHAGADAGPHGRRELVAGYVDLVERHADLIRVLASDPSVKESAGLHVAAKLFRRLLPLLAGTANPDPAQRTRVRAAMSAVHGVLVHAQPDEDPEVLHETAIEVARAALGLHGRQPAKSTAKTKTTKTTKGSPR